jgi:hypothetical protein
VATVIPFPLHLRRRLVRLEADRFASQPHQAAEYGLQSRLMRLRDDLIGLGIDPLRVEKEVQALAGAVLAEAADVLREGARHAR